MQKVRCRRPGCTETARTAKGYCSHVCYAAHMKKDHRCTCGRTMRRGSTKCVVCNAAKDHTRDAFSVTGNDATLANTTAQRVRTLADLIRVCEIDTGEWDVIEWRCTASQQSAVPRTIGSKQKGWSRETTEPMLTQMFHVSAKLRRRVEVLAIQAELASLIADAKAKIRPLRAAALVHRKRGPSGLMLELGIPDLHLGKLAWGAETGHDNYDTKIAVDVFTSALDALLARTAPLAFDRILLVVGNDLLNTDTKASTTTAGTPQDSDGRYHRSFLAARRMLVRAIEDRLAPLALRIDLPIVPGNHDTLAAWHLGDSLECYFHGRTNIVIDNAPTPRKYIQHGEVMLMFHHGDKIKARSGKVSASLIMAQERPQMWAATRHREIHVGHLHHKEVQEQHGVVTRVLSALCPVDAWHSEQGYIGQARAAEAFVWHEHEGQIASAHYTVPVAERR